MIQFLESNCIQHGQSSPYNPKSNGHAEQNVKILKDLILKTNNDISSKEFLDGITQIRNSPRADGLSLCQVVFGRSIRTLIPTLTEALGTNDFVEKARRRKQVVDAKQKIFYDRCSKMLKPLNDGMLVWIQNPETKRWDLTARIISRVRKRTYKLEMFDGRITHRNRRWIRKYKGNQMMEKNLTTNDEGAQEMIPGEDNLPKMRRSKRIEQKKTNSRVNF